MPARTFFLWCALYEMATGTLPFRGRVRLSSPTPSSTELPLSRVRLNPDIPPKLEDVINKALEKDKNLRYQSAADMRTDLQPLKRDTESGRSAR